MEFINQLVLFALMFLCFIFANFASMGIVHSFKKLVGFVKRRIRVRKLRSEINAIMIEPHADRDAFAFAFAVSPISSQDMPIAVNMHPLTRQRFSSRGRKWICHQSIILRKDEHMTLVIHSSKWRRVIRDHLTSESRTR
jgi:hypothetical protein